MERIRIIALLCCCVLASTACAATGEVEQPLLEAQGGAPASASVPLTTTWCAARTVLEQKCQRCHGAEPEHGAPFSLVTLDDTQVVNTKGKARYELIAAAVTSDYMPPSFLDLSPPVELLTDDQRATLLDWCDAGGPASEDCDAD